VAYDTREREKEALLKKRQRDSDSPEHAKRAKTEDEENKDKDKDANGKDIKQEHPEEAGHVAEGVKQEEDKPKVTTPLCCVRFF
jgi:hypothetical protein